MENKNEKKSVVNTKAKSSDTLVIQRRNNEEGLKQMYGTGNLDMIAFLSYQLLQTLPDSWPKVKGKEFELPAAFQSMIQPRDEIEALLGSQMAAVHNLAMTFMSRANATEQPTDIVNSNIERASKLLKIYVSQMEALNRHRGKGQQKVTVEHVTVNQGGQAIVGTVDTSGGRDGGHGQ